MNYLTEALQALEDLSNSDEYDIYSKLKPNELIWDASEELPRTYQLPEYITKVFVKYGSETIGGPAFYHPNNVTEIVIPNTVVRIVCLSGCNKLEHIELPESVIAICGSAFEYCSNLKEVELPESLRVIGPDAFIGCEGLTELIIPESVYKIGEDAFSECPNLCIKTKNPYVIDYCRYHDVEYEDLREGY